MANRICYTRDGDAEVRPAALEQRDQRRGGGDRRQLLAAGPARCHVRQHFLNLQERSEEGIASNILADRLRRLVAGGLLARRTPPVVTAPNTAFPRP